MLRLIWHKSRQVSAAFECALFIGILNLKERNRLSARKVQTMILKGILISAGIVALAAPAMAQSGKKSSGSGSSSTPTVALQPCGDVNYSGGQVDCACPANSGGGSVWGSGPYTGDSHICTAAMHAGVIGASGGNVRLIDRPGQSSYAGSSANGVQTSSWGSYGQSYDVASPDGSATVVVEPPASEYAACGAYPVGQNEYACYCAPGDTSGSLWGNDPYTADSSICAAAVHSGYIGEDGGDVYVLGLPGLSGYYGAENNGVTSGDWGSYSNSFVSDRNR